MSRLAIASHSVACLLSACEPSAEPTPPVVAASAGPSASTAPSAPAPPPSPGGTAASEVVPALRCGECHEKMYEEWETSRHHGAEQSGLYRALRADAHSDACDRCHAPLGALTPPDSPAARDGVSCEVCHRIEDAEVREDGPGFSLRPKHDVKFGPLCDAKQPYFHRSECSPLFESSVLCGSCHTWVRKSASGEPVPVYTEYLDWKAGPSRDKPCQSCHMPGARASLASSEPEREGVPDHGFLGEAGALRGTGVTVTAALSAVGSRLRIAARVRNARAGHDMPAGMSGRQLVLRARALSTSGVAADEAEVVFERRLVDARGQEAPFYRASAVGADTRLAPRQTRTVTLELEGAAAGQLELALVRRPLSPTLARRLGQDATESVVHVTTVAIEAPTAGGRPGLRQTVRLPP